MRTSLNKLTKQNSIELFKRFQTQILFIAIITIGLLSSLHQRLNIVIYDSLINYFNLPQPNHVVLIDIDDKSLNSLGEWPWKRSVHAKLIDNLQDYQPRAIGIDVLFPSNSSSSAADNALLATSIKNANNVVLAVSPKLNAFDNVPEQLPQANLAVSAKALGHVDFEFDLDGAIRKSFLYAGYQEARWPAFSYALVNTAYPELMTQTDREYIESGQNWVRQMPVRVNYYVSNGEKRLPNISYIDVLNQKVNKELIQNKIVIVGMNATALADRFASPLTNQYYNLTGAEINAHLTNSIANNKVILGYPQIAYWLVVGLFIFFAYLSAKHRLMQRPQVWLLVNLSILICFTVTNFVFFQYWYPPIINIALLFIAFTFMTAVKQNKQEATLHQLNQQLILDEVTGLLNENGFMTKLNKELTAQKNKVVVLINIARYTAIADLYSIEQQNSALKTITSRIKNTLPETSLIARTFHANFILALDIIDHQKTMQVINALQQELTMPISIQQIPFKLISHVGISEYPIDGNNAQTLISAAQSAINKAKQSNNSCICLYNQDIRQQLQKEIELEHEIQTATSNNEIKIYYQPQVNSKTMEIVGAEALIRWQHPTKGMINPADFIPIAEQNNSIVEIGQWVIFHACQTAKRWQDKYKKSFKIAVNLSPKQFTHPNLVKDINVALRSSKLAPECLELELTESCIVDNIELATKILLKLKTLGVVLSIDDFGTGYSSLSYLNHFPVDKLKIDRSFVKELGADESANKLTTSIISLAQSLNLKVVAEGVETEEQQQFLSQSQVDELQGFLFSKPISEQDMSDLLKENLTLPNR